MVIYHCSVKTVGRSAGRSAVASAAYRSGVYLKDERTGEVHDYRRKAGIEHTELFLPSGVKFDREHLWNSAEASEKRKNSTVAREYEISLPEELNSEQRTELTRDFARHLVDRYGVAVDVSIHAPSRGGDIRNYHAHILTTTRQVTPQGFAAKTRVLDDKKTGEIEHVRATWAQLTNQALERAGHPERVSHKSLEAQGIDREPTTHLGPAATAMERRGIQTERGELNRSVLQGLASDELTALEKQQHGINTARQRFNMEKAERAKKERQRLQHEAQKERERKAQQKERDCVNSLFLKSYVDKGCREMVTSVEWELAKWDKATPEDRAKLEQQAETRIAKINKEREERRQRERARERDGGWSL
ncbi:MobQ family relaxase [Acidaminococcus intestini]|jgi:ATP-dependent exoDNAse (exonuclease V) alpha subunit|uniref:MobQ family relaxase n=1 Tax=Acidaminococcus intestini TaxID=187327 RepID=UPI00241DEB2A|nr:MobQ family relaxase [Acidaminococcus intestini]